MEKCKGKNCESLNGFWHSEECISEHDKCVNSGAGNRNPDARYRGYKGLPPFLHYTPDEYSAWEEGNEARISA